MGIKSRDSYETDLGCQSVLAVATFAAVRLQIFPRSLRSQFLNLMK